MRDEFLLNCEKEILEANLFLMCGQHEEGVQAARKVLDAIMKEIVNSIQPITKNTQPYVIAALRALANGLEKQLDGKWKTTISVVTAVASKIEFEIQEEEINETDNEKPRK